MCILFMVSFKLQSNYAIKAMTCAANSSRLFIILPACINVWMSSWLVNMRFYLFVSWGIGLHLSTWIATFSLPSIKFPFAGDFIFLDFMQVVQLRSICFSFLRIIYGGSFDISVTTLRLVCLSLLCHSSAVSSANDFLLIPGKDLAVFRTIPCHKVWLFLQWISQPILLWVPVQEVDSYTISDRTDSPYFILSW